MSHITNTTLAPMKGCDVVARFNNAATADIPMLEIGFDLQWHHAPAVTITLGNHDDAAGWLRAAAERMVALAEEIEAAAIDKAVQA